MPTVNVHEMILRVRDMAPVTPATKQRCAGSLSVCASLLHNPEEGHHTKCNCLESMRSNVVKTYIYQRQEGEDIKVFSFTAITKLISEVHGDLL